MAAPKEDILVKNANAYDLLKKVRESKTVALKPTKMLRTEILGLDGKPQPFKLRYYQVQGIFHLLTMKRMVLGDGTGLGKCKSAKTLVLTNLGLVPLDSLAPIPTQEMVEDTFYPMVEPVQIWTGSSWAPIKNFYWAGKKPTKVIRTSRGYSTDGSWVHPLWVRTPQGEVFVPISSLKKGAWIAIERSTTASFPSTEPLINFSPLTDRKLTYPKQLTPDLASLLGWVVGEAWVMSRVTTNISQYPGEGHNEIRRLLKEVFGWTGNLLKLDADKAITVSSVDIRAFFLQCGVEFELSARKKVPTIVLKGTSDSVRNFLQAYFEAEASVCSTGGVEVSSASRVLLEEVHQLLLRFGVVGTLSSKWNKKYKRHYYRISFFGLDARIFQEKIGFFSTEKKGLLESSFRGRLNTNKDVVPYCAGSVQILRKEIVRLMKAHAKTQGLHNCGGWGLLSIGAGFQTTFKHVVSGHRNASYEFLTRLLTVAKAWGLTDLTAYRDLEQIVGRHFFYDQIVEISDTENYLMDIEVADQTHTFVADGFVNHNTIEAIAAFCYIWEKEPTTKVVVVSPKSAIRQWASEFQRFTTGVKCFIVQGKAEERKVTYEAFQAHPTGPEHPRAVLLTGYAPLVRDWNAGAARPLLPNGQPNMKVPATLGVLDGVTKATPNIVAVFDECTAFKNSSTKTWQVCRELSDRAARCYGLSATLLKNNLMEGFCIYKCIHPDVFTTKTRFLEDYCVTKMQPVGGGRKIPIVVGYRNLQAFRDRIDPFFLGRPKHVVSDELPKLITKEVMVELSAAEDAKYGEALTGILSLGDGDVKDYEEHKKLVALVYCQKTVDSLSLLKYGEGDLIDIDMFHQEQDAVKETGSKEQALLDLLTEEFEDEKVIVYTRFASLVPRLQELCLKLKIKSVAVTGDVVDTAKNPARQKAQQAFQDLNSDVRVIFISDAGSEAINLQAASAMIFYNAPWSWGNYLQLLGRPIRIGSPHQHVVAVHLVAERPRKTAKDRKTIDHYTLDILAKKKDLIDKVLGEAAVGALDFDSGDSFTVELMRELRKSK